MGGWSWWADKNLGEGIHLEKLRRAWKPLSWQPLIKVSLRNTIEVWIQTSKNTDACICFRYLRNSYVVTRHLRMRGREGPNLAVAWRNRGKRRNTLFRGSGSSAGVWIRKSTLLQWKSSSSRLFSTITINHSTHRQSPFSLLLIVLIAITVFMATEPPRRGLCQCICWK
jgi:hypothetical protein